VPPYEGKQYGYCREEHPHGHQVDDRRGGFGPEKLDEVVERVKANGHPQGAQQQVEQRRNDAEQKGEDDFAETLPLDEERRNGCLVDAAFAERAAFTPRFAASIVEWDAAMRDQLVMLFRGHQQAGALDTRLDLQILARSLLALAAGLATQLLYDPRPDSDVRALLDQSVGSLLRLI
jgi:hypothetical protein